jgi:hypothetical protein
MTARTIPLNGARRAHSCPDRRERGERVSNTVDQCQECGTTGPGALALPSVRLHKARVCRTHVAGQRLSLPSVRSNCYDSAACPAAERMRMTASGLHMVESTQAATVGELRERLDEV